MKKLSLSVMAGVMVFILILAGIIITPAFQSGDYMYTIAGDYAVITGYQGTGGDITVPANIDNYPVAGIDKEAFKNCESLFSITLPAGITDIGDSAFCGCKSLYAAYFMGDAPALNQGVFNNCDETFTVYYLKDSLGFSNPWLGYGTAVFSPVITPALSADNVSPTNKSITITITFPEGTVQKEYRINAGEWFEYTSPVSMDSNGVVYARGIDEAGLFSKTARLSVNNIDKDPPAAPVLSASATQPTNGDVTVTIVYPDDAAVKEYKLEGGDWSVYSGPILLVSNDTVSARCRDAAGNLSDINSITVDNIDKSPPAVPLLSASTTLPTNGSVTVTILYPADAAVKEYKLGDGDWAEYTKPVMLASNNTVSARCKDAVGNISDTSSITIGNIDKDPPANPALSASTTLPTDGPVTITVNYPDDAFVKEYRLSSGIWQDYTGPVLLAVNSTISARCRDEAGNLGDTGSLTVSNINDSGIFSYTIADSVAQITKYNGSGGDVTIPGNIGGGYPVTSIGVNAFQNYTVITGIAIPDSVTNISSGAFWGCSGLTNAFLPDSIANISSNAFNGCIKLTGIDIPKNVKTIGNSAFRLCGSLSAAAIPNGALSIGNEAFKGCTGLASVSIPSSVKAVGYDAFAGTPWFDNYPGEFIVAGSQILIGYKGTGAKVAVPETVKCIGGGAFHDKTGITGVIIPAGVTYIGDSAFAGCTKLTDIRIPDTVTGIGVSAFEGCRGLTSAVLSNSLKTIQDSVFHSCTAMTGITIPDSVTAVGTYAFAACEKLSNVAIGSGVKDIGQAAFSGCIALKSLSLPDNITSIGKDAFCGCKVLNTIAIPSSVCVISSGMFSGCTGLTGVTIPDTVVSIGTGAFSGCTVLKSLTIPSKVTSICEDTFYNCSGLTNVSIPAGVTSIGKNAFSGCKVLIGLELPSSLKTIGENAFSGCMRISGVAIPKNVTAIGSNAFSGCVGLGIAYFLCNAPSMGPNVFYNCRPLFNICYFSSCTGFTDPWYGYKTAAFLPKLSVSSTTPTAGDVTVTVTYPSIAIIKEYKIGSGVWTAYTAPLTITANGTVYARCTDAYDNTSAEVSVKVNNIDKDPPAAPTLCASTTQPTNGNVKVTINYPADASTKEYKTNLQDWAVYTAPVTLTVNDTVYARCKDALGNTSVTSSIKINNIDKTAPVITGVGNNTTYTVSKKITFNEGTAKLDGNPFASGTVVSVNGTHTLTVTDSAGNATTVKFTMNIPVPVTKIILSSSSLTWITGYSGIITYTVIPGNATKKAVRWTSSNSTVAVVNSSGLVKALAIGSATITCSATDGSGIGAACKITVGKPAASITLNTSSLKWAVGKTGTITAKVSPSDAIIKTVSWSSSNTNVATVDSTGKVKAAGIGAAVLTCKATDGSGKKATCAITVGKPVTSITLSAANLKWTVGKSAVITAGVLPADAVDRSVSWSSSNASAVTVDSTGKIKAVGAGYAIITCAAKDGSGKKATCAVTVNPLAPAGLKAVKASAISIKLAWVKAGSVTGYEVYRSTSKTGKYEKIKTTASNSFTDTGLTKGKTYYYKIRAYKLVSLLPYYSAFSSIVYLKL